MVGFSGILGTGQVEDQKIIKGKLIDGKKLWIGLGVVVSLMIIQFRPKLLHWGSELTEEDFFKELPN